MTAVPLLILSIFLLFPAQTSSNSVKEADQAFSSGIEFYEARDYRKAIECFNSAAVIDRELGESRLSDLAFDYKALGLCYTETGQASDALNYYRQAFALFKELGDFTQAIQTMNNSGLVYYYQGQYADAIRDYKKALDYSEDTGVEEEIPLILNNLGLVYYAYGQYSRAVECYERACEKNKELGRDFYTATNLGNIASVYLAWGRFTEAVENYSEALTIFEKLGDIYNTASTLVNIGLVYYSCGKYDQSYEYYEKAMILAEEHSLKAIIAAIKNSMGSIFYATGRYDQALISYEQALSIYEDFSSAINIASVISSIGMVYQAWGKWNRALKQYQTALKLVQDLGVRDQVALNLRLIGSVHQAEMHYRQAVDTYGEAIDIFRELGRETDIAVTLNTLGTAYFEWGKYELAIQYYEQALSIAETIGKDDEIARDLIHIGGIFQVRRNYKDALQYYNRALKITESIDSKADRATCLNNMGTVYFNLKDYDTAAYYFSQSIEVKEELRLTAKGDIRRDFLASWISTYRWLILTYLHDNKPEAVFETMELVTARYLAEQIGERLEQGNSTIKGIKPFSKKLDDRTAVIQYANVDWQESVAAYADTGKITAVSINKKDFIAGCSGKLNSAIEKAAADSRGFTMIPVEREIETKAETKHLTDIITYYRRLLNRSSPTREQIASREQIARALYKLLLEPFEEDLADKSELIIIPDGILAFLPFETLILPDGRFLVERYYISYTPALTILELIESRAYTDERRPFLAFGGAVYDEVSYKKDMIVSKKQLEYFKSRALLAIKENRSTRDAYGALGLASWSNLPGTQTEVEAIGSIVSGSTVYTGARVNEAVIKRMSEQGALKNYKVIHFATHGLVVPLMPELSALVLSQFAQEQQAEDGYLTMKEIAELKITADFVNLSACETGLGRIYSGEGVVGLTHAFLTAGANGLSVSLWQVADESTMKFMIGLYNIVQEKDLTYFRAITEMKRRFISEGRYSQPFFWAPFVCYGR